MRTHTDTPNTTLVREVFGKEIDSIGWFQSLVNLHSQRMNGILADERWIFFVSHFIFVFSNWILNTFLFLFCRQGIAFLAYLKETNQSRGIHSSVVPSSILNNWEKELAKCPALIVEKYYGIAAERRSWRKQCSKNGVLTGGIVDILLTTYNMILSGLEDRKWFRRNKWQYVIFDEAEKHVKSNLYTYG